MPLFSFEFKLNVPALNHTQTPWEPPKVCEQECSRKERRARHHFHGSVSGTRGSMLGRPAGLRPRVEGPYEEGQEGPSPPGSRNRFRRWLHSLLWRYPGEE